MVARGEKSITLEKRTAQGGGAHSKYQGPSDRTGFEGQKKEKGWWAGLPVQKKGKNREDVHTAVREETTAHEQGHHGGGDAEAGVRVVLVNKNARRGTKM